MDVAKLKVARTYAGVVSRDTITAGLGGATISVEYAPGIWDGLTKTVVFRGSVSKDVITNDTTIKIPPEVLTEPNKRLSVGFCGMDHKKMLVIPTIWADLGLIQPGADPSGDTSTDPSLPVWAQIAGRVDELADEVEGLKQSGGVGPGTPGKPGADGEDGGYYTPSVSQPDPKSIQFSYAPSKPTMPAVEPETITLPVPESGGNVDYGAENAGKLLYVGADGVATVLTLGAGLAIVNGALTITSAQVTASICGMVLCDNNTICGGA